MSLLLHLPRQTAVALLLAAALALPALRAADAPAPAPAPAAAAPAPAPVAPAAGEEAAEKVAPPAKAKGAVVGEWTQDLDAAVALAKSKNLPVLLNFTGSDWCGWCTLMDKQVFSQAEWTKYAATHAVLVTLDYPKDETRVPAEYKARNEKLRDLYKVEGYPTFVLLDTDGTTELGRLGASPDVSAAKFIRQFNQAYDRRPAGIEARCKVLKPEEAAAYKDALASNKKTMDEVQAWLATNPDDTPENQEKYKKFQETVMAAQKKITDMEVKARAATLGDKAPAYLAAYQSLQAAQQELDAWLTTKPERNADNDKKYAGFKAKLDAGEKAMAGYEL